MSYLLNGIVDGTIQVYQFSFIIGVGGSLGTHFLYGFSDFNMAD